MGLNYANQLTLLINIYRMPAWPCMDVIGSVTPALDSNRFRKAKGSVIGQEAILDPDCLSGTQCH